MLKLTRLGPREIIKSKNSAHLIQSKLIKESNHQLERLIALPTNDDSLNTLWQHFNNQLGTQSADSLEEYVVPLLDKVKYSYPSQLAHERTSKLLSLFPNYLTKHEFLEHNELYTTHPEQIINDLKPIQPRLNTLFLILKNSAFTDAISLINQWHNMDIYPLDSRITLNSQIDLCKFCKSDADLVLLKKEPHLSYPYYTLIENKSIKHHNQMIKTIIQYGTRNDDRIMNIFSNLKERNMETFESVLHFLLKENHSSSQSKLNLDAAVQVYKEMLNGGLEPGVKLLTTFIKAYHSKNQWGTVKNLFSLLDFEGGSKSIKGDLKVATAYANAMIDSLNESEFKKIVELVACSSFFLDIKWLTTLVRGFTKFQMPDECCKIETQLKTRHGLRINDLHIILHAQCIRSDWHSVNETLLQLESFNQSIRTTNILLQGYAYHSDTITLESIFSNITLPPPDTSTYNIMMSHYMQLNDSRLAKNTYNKMIQSGLKPDKYTYSLLVTMKTLSEDLQGASEVLDGIVKDDIVQKYEMYKSLSKYFLMTRDDSNAKNLDYIMQNHGVYPPVSHYNRILKMCRKQNDIQQCDTVYEKMIEKQVLPNLDTYQILIETCLSENEHSKANDWLERAFIDLSPNIILLNSFIAHFVKLGDRIEIKRILSRVKELKLMPTLETYTLLMGLGEGVSRKIQSKLNSNSVLGGSQGELIGYDDLFDETDSVGLELKEEEEEVGGNRNYTFEAHDYSRRELLHEDELGIIASIGKQDKSIRVMKDRFDD